MTVSEAQKKASKKYFDTNYKNTTIGTNIFCETLRLENIVVPIYTRAINKTATHKRRITAKGENEVAHAHRRHPHNTGER